MKQATLKGTCRTCKGSVGLVDGRWEHRDLASALIHGIIATITKPQTKDDFALAGPSKGSAA